MTFPCMTCGAGDPLLWPAHRDSCARVKAAAPEFAALIAEAGQWREESRVRAGRL